jgi:hypothetical protein
MALGNLGQLTCCLGSRPSRPRLVCFFIRSKVSPTFPVVDHLAFPLSHVGVFGANKLRAGAQAAQAHS